MSMPKRRTGSLKKLSQEQAKEAVLLYDAGWSCGDLGKRYGVSRQSMWDLLHRRTEMRDNLRYGVDNHFYRGGKTASDHAQNMLEQAIIRGEVIRRTTCENCGESGVFKDGRTKVQAHHPDYNRPLEVLWLCQPCHHEWHKHNKAKEVMPEEADTSSICSLEASRNRVRTSPTQGSAPAWRVIDPASGSRWHASFAHFNHEWSSLKTSQGSCVPWQEDQGSLLSESSSLIWPSSGMTLDGVAYELPTWEPRISAIESSLSPGEEVLFPTPSAWDAKGGESKEQRREREAGGSMLKDIPHLLARTLPTPTAGDAKSSGSRNLPGSKAKDGVSLTDVFRTGGSTTPRNLLPTPVANEKNPGSGGELRAALTHGPGRRNETGIDSWGRPNTGRAKLLPTPTTQDAANTAGPSQFRRNSDPLNVAVVKTLLPSPTVRTARRGKGDPERYRGTKSQGSRRSNLEDAIEVIKDPETWTGDFSGQQYEDGSSSPAVHPDQLTILGD